MSESKRPRRGEVQNEDKEEEEEYTFDDVDITVPDMSEALCNLKRSLQQVAMQCDALVGAVYLRNQKIIQRESIVPNFLKEHRDTIRGYFLSQSRRNPVLPCKRSRQSGIWLIPAAMRDKYQIPLGVMGAQSKKHSQAFVAYLKGVRIGAEALGLNTKDIVFEDPRDCGEVLTKITRLFHDHYEENV